MSGCMGIGGFEQNWLEDVQAGRHEIARRRCLAELANPNADTKEILLKLHQNLQFLGDMEGCRTLLERVEQRYPELYFEVLLRRISDCAHFASMSFYRLSPEARDGTFKELTDVQHKTSLPRLDDFKTWTLDTPDAVERPCTVARREDILAIRDKRQQPHLADMWQKTCRYDPRDRGEHGGPVGGLRFLVEGDPALAWHIKRHLVAVMPIRTRMALLGREYSDMYSPVGLRPLTPWVEEYDLLADRVDLVGTIGAAFGQLAGKRPGGLLYTGQRKMV